MAKAGLTQSLLLAIIVVLAGIVLYLFFTRRSPDIVVGPSQKELNEIKRKNEVRQDSLVMAIQAIRQEKTADSLRRVQGLKESNRVIRGLEGKVNELKVELLKDLPDSSRIEKQDEVIGLQSKIINQQRERITNDSLFIAKLEANFSERITAQLETEKLLRETIDLKDQEISRKDAEIKKRKTGGLIKVGIIAGLSYLLIRQ